MMTWTLTTDPTRNFSERAVAQECSWSEEEVAFHWNWSWCNLIQAAQGGGVM